MNRRIFLKQIIAAASGLLGLPKLYLKAASPTQGFLIPPTVQHVNDSSAVLYFRLAEATQNGKVIISQGGSIVQEIPFASAEDLRQQITVAGLASSTTYSYQVLVDDAEIPYLGSPHWTGLQFTTAPYGFPLRATALGDTGFGQATTARIAEQIAAQNPHLFLHLGDVVYGMDQNGNDPYINWQKKYFEPFKPLLARMPTYPTLGNHELDSPAFFDGLPSYFWMFPPFSDQQNGLRMWYSFDMNGIQFLSLNTQVHFNYGDMIDAQNAWLDERLARTDVAYTIPFCHVAPFSSSIPHQYDGNIAAEQWHPRFVAARVPLVISGHAHVYERLKVDSVNYVVAGAGSDTRYNLGERLSSSLTFSNQSSYPIIDFYPDHIHLTVRTATGEVLDDLDLEMPA